MSDLNFNKFLETRNDVKAPIPVKSEYEVPEAMIKSFQSLFEMVLVDMDPYVEVALNNLISNSLKTAYGMGFQDGKRTPIKDDY